MSASDLEHFFNIRLENNHVTIQRSSGIMENDWRLIKVYRCSLDEPFKALVHKTTTATQSVAETTFAKSVNLDDFLQWNKGG